MSQDFDDLQARADERLEVALEERGARDPRDFYRGVLRELKGRDEAAYQEAVRYYEEELVPTVADDGSDPLAAWTGYGRTLAELTAEGRTMAIGPRGRAEPYEPPPAEDRLILHLPDARKRKALLVGLPAELSDAQRATYDWLVAGKRRR